MKALEQMRSLALWLCLAALAGSAMAQVYTWTDANGKKHFGDAATRPSDKTSPEIKVPPANVADRFEPRPAPPPIGQPEPKIEDPMLASPAPPAPARPVPKVSSVERDQDTCRAKWDAYDASAACYAECGKNIACRNPDAFRSCGRNNAACGHCSDAPMPRC